MASWIRPFAEIRLADVPLVGGKNASLGELYGELTGAGIRVPNGFAITADAHTALLDLNGLRPRIAGLLQGVDGQNVTALAAAGAGIRPLIEQATLPPGLEDFCAPRLLQGLTGARIVAGGLGHLLESK